MAKSLARVVVRALSLAGTLCPHGCGLLEADRLGDAVPAASGCFSCPGGTASRVLGFSAAQLVPPGLVVLRAWLGGLR